MKKLFAILLTSAFLLTGCAAPRLVLTETETAEEVTTAAETNADGGAHNTTGFCAGFGRRDITPENSVPLAGYGNTEMRMSAHILDPLYCSCVALKDAEGAMLLLFNMDLINMKKDLADMLRRMAARSTGVPEEQMLFNCTHTHSGPDTYKSDTNADIGHWLPKLCTAVREAAEEAVKDLDASSILTGAIDTDRLNFVRRYYKENGFVCDNADYGTGEIIGHESEIDPEMRLIRLVRENQKDIVLANYQAHPTKTGGYAKTDISADVIGAWRRRAEKDLDVHFAFFQGGAGNVNFGSRINGEVRFTDYKDIGKALNETMKEGLARNMSETPAGRIRVASSVLTATYQKGDEDKLDACYQVNELWTAGKKDEAKTLAVSLGISSPYEASAIIARQDRPETGEIYLACYAFGDIAITAAPFEMFCQTEKAIREASPFAFTFSCGYSNDRLGYMPAAECWVNKGYEVVTCRFTAGTAEAINERQLELLNELKTEILKKDG